MLTQSTVRRPATPPPLSIGRPGKLRPTPVVNRYGRRAVRPRATAGARPRGPAARGGRPPGPALWWGPGAALVTARPAAPRAARRAAAGRRRRRRGRGHVGHATVRKSYAAGLK